MLFEYPQVGFHFAVTFELFPQSLHDIKFREVTGLSTTMEFEALREGGENRFVHQLPVKTTFSDLTLKRGVFLDTQLLGLTPWFRDALEDFKFKPVNLTISLLNELHLPLYNWYVVGAIPKKLEFSGLNAQSNEIVVETMVLQYQYFKYLSAGSLIAGAVSAAAGAIGGSISL